MQRQDFKSVCKGKCYIFPYNECPDGSKGWRQRWSGRVAFTRSKDAQRVRTPVLWQKEGASPQQTAKDGWGGLLSHGRKMPILKCEYSSLRRGTRECVHPCCGRKKAPAINKPSTSSSQQCENHIKGAHTQPLLIRKRRDRLDSGLLCLRERALLLQGPACQAPVLSRFSQRLIDAVGFQTMEVSTVQESLLKEVKQALGSPLGTQPQAPNQKPLVVVISGPSGVGKDAVIKRLQEVRNEIHFVVTATTRAKRPGEVHGQDYFFLAKEEFESMIHNGELLEYAVVYGDYKGIPKGQVRECLAKGFDAVLRIDVQGAATVRSIFGSEAVFIFLVAETEAALVQRLMERKTETKDKLLLRIATAREELKRMNEFDYVVVNADNQLEKAVSLICHIIDAEKARVHQREAHI